MIRDRYFSCSEINSLYNKSTNHEDIWTHITKIGTVEKIEPEYFLEKYKTRCCQAQLRDNTGVVNLTLWEEDIDRVQNGYKIKIENGLIKEISGKKRFSTGFLGRLTILEIPKKSPSVLAPVRSY